MEVLPFILHHPPAPNHRRILHHPLRHHLYSLLENPKFTHKHFLQRLGWQYIRAIIMRQQFDPSLLRIQYQRLRHDTTIAHIDLVDARLHLCVRQ